MALKRQRIGLGSVLVVIALATSFISTARGALFEGKTMTADYRTDAYGLDFIVSSNPFVVGPQVELTGFGEHTDVPPFQPPLFDIDVSDTNILVTSLIDQPMASISILRLVDINSTINPIKGATINPATNWAGLTQGRIQALGNVVQFTLSNLSALAGQKISLDVAAFPEPAGALLGAIALGSLWVRRRC